MDNNPFYGSMSNAWNPYDTMPRGEVVGDPWHQGLNTYFRLPTPAETSYLGDLPKESPLFTSTPRTVSPESVLGARDWMASNRPDFLMPTPDRRIGPEVLGPPVPGGIEAHKDRMRKESMPRRPELRIASGGGVGAAPTFNKSLADYINSADVKEHVASSINVSNRPHRRAIKERKGELGRDVETLRVLNDEALRVAQGIRKERQESEKARGERKAEIDERLIDARRVAEEAGPVSSAVSAEEREAPYEKSRQRGEEDRAARESSAEEYARASEDRDRSYDAMLELDKQQESARMGKEARRDIKSTRAQMADTAAAADLMARETANQMYNQALARYQADVSSYNAMANRAMQQQAMDQSVYDRTYDRDLEDYERGLSPADYIGQLPAGDRMDLVLRAQQARAAQEMNEREAQAELNKNAWEAALKGGVTTTVGDPAMPGGEIRQKTPNMGLYQDYRYGPQQQNPGMSPWFQNLFMGG